MSAVTEEAASAPATVLAWDLPTRLAKWLLAALVGLAFASKYYGDVGLVWHQWNGLAILVVLVFRLLWGLVGGSTARFSAFLRGPGAALGYGLGLLRGRPAHYLGHNPLGGWMVIALLLVAAAQALTGLFTTDDIIVYAPMTAVASDETIARASALHQQIYPILLGLIALHVVANIAYSALGSDNLIAAMVLGRKPAGRYVDPAPATPGSVALAIACLAVAVLVVFGGIALAGGNPFP
ncbi:cytochrome b/b6 domain-containing protein [Ancylobacter sp. MQZ15Z-1]|uniref:Cytochrome b/b6 domain-containing protein n=1 Tax=Ancylobacter mangrovi TaxID=2972472 RepID=A0A9X2PHF8_9HYPH|nr:cytochrome b/b6 domain-containing protein [Ancylobacter mangrovi]MCS0496155.1 cytochrome b/b6 domain-containing protein [Ancylobacter mangrovi]